MAHEKIKMLFKTKACDIEQRPKSSRAYLAQTQPSDLPLSTVLRSFAHKCMEEINSATNAMEGSISLEKKRRLFHLFANIQNRTMKLLVIARWMDRAGEHSLVMGAADFISSAQGNIVSCADSLFKIAAAAKRNACQPLSLRRAVDVLSCATFAHPCYVESEIGPPKTCHKERVAHIGFDHCRKITLGRDIVYHHRTFKIYFAHGDEWRVSKIIDGERRMEVGMGRWKDLKEGIETVVGLLDKNEERADANSDGEVGQEQSTKAENETLEIKEACLEMGLPFYPLEDETVFLVGAERRIRVSAVGGVFEAVAGDKKTVVERAGLRKCLEDLTCAVKTVSDKALVSSHEQSSDEGPSSTSSIWSSLKKTAKAEGLSFKEKDMLFVLSPQKESVCFLRKEEACIAVVGDKRHALTCEDIKQARKHGTTFLAQMIVRGLGLLEACMAIACTVYPQGLGRVVLWCGKSRVLVKTAKEGCIMKTNAARWTDIERLFRPKENVFFRDGVILFEDKAAGCVVGEFVSFLHLLSDSELFCTFVSERGLDIDIKENGFVFEKKFSKGGWSVSVSLHWLFKLRLGRINIDCALHACSLIPPEQNTVADNKKVFMALTTLLAREEEELRGIFRVLSGGRIKLALVDGENVCLKDDNKKAEVVLKIRRGAEWATFPVLVNKETGKCGFLEVGTDEEKMVRQQAIRELNIRTERRIETVGLLVEEAEAQATALCALLFHI
eukprot:GHVN01049779.1.p1 GENE.GHVN01049779.1~~GHVN01049779.1.p1  ORF type:complete len:727 (+),score=102.32 GHVN01049779.1:1391-3571(+)